jgi:alpha-tubulin suppressor-like RCC1 family protein
MKIKLIVICLFSVCLGKISAQNKFIDIEAGSYFVLALKDDGTLWSWGINSQGQLGRGYVSQYDSIPQQIGADKDWVKLITGTNESMAIKKDGSMWAWGMNYDNNLGVGDEYAITFPRRFGENKKWKTACIDHSYTISIDEHGRSNCNLDLGVNPRFYDTAKYNIKEIQALSGGLSFTDTSGMLYYIPDEYGYGAAVFGKVQAFDNYGGRCVYVDQNNAVYERDTLDCEGEYKVVHRKVMENVKVKKLISKLHGKYLLEEDGKLWYWGCNNFGFSGLGHNKVVHEPSQIAPEIHWVDITFIASDMPLLLSEDGGIYLINSHQFSIPGVFRMKQCLVPCLLD